MKHTTLILQWLLPLLLPVGACVCVVVIGDLLWPPDCRVQWHAGGCRWALKN